MIPQKTKLLSLALQNIYNKKIKIKNKKERDNASSQFSLRCWVFSATKQKKRVKDGIRRREMRGTYHS
jgi:hypothetical protein